MKRSIMISLALLGGCGETPTSPDREGPVSDLDGDDGITSIQSSANAQGAEGSLSVWYSSEQFGAVGRLNDPGVADELFGGSALEVGALPFGSYNVSLLSAFESNEAPDVFIGSALAGLGFSGLELIEPLCSEGECSCDEDGESWCNPDPDGDGVVENPALAAVSRVGDDGGISAVGMPLFWDFPVVLFNASWFEAHEQEVPTSIDALGFTTKTQPEAVFHDATWFFAQHDISLGESEVPDFNSLYSVTPDLEETGLMIVHASNIATLRETYGAAFEEQMKVLALEEYRPAVSVLAAFVPGGDSQKEGLGFALAARDHALTLTHNPTLSGDPTEDAQQLGGSIAAILGEKGSKTLLCVGSDDDAASAACEGAEDTMGAKTSIVESVDELEEIVFAALESGTDGFVAADPRMAVAIDELLIDAGVEGSTRVASLGRSLEMLGHMGQYGAESHIVSAAAREQATLLPASPEELSKFIEAESNLMVDVTGIGIYGDPLPGTDIFNPGDMMSWTWHDFSGSIAKGAAVGTVSGAVGGAVAGSAAGGVGAGPGAAAGAAAGTLGGAAAGAAGYVWDWAIGGLPQGFDQQAQFSTMVPEVALDG